MNLSEDRRPSKFEDFCGNKPIVKDLKKYLRTGNVPHLMFVGPRGIGKNTLAYIFATEYFGRKISIGTGDSDRDYTELNASDERGIDIVRDFIKTRAKTTSMTPGKRRIIFLDEVDNMTLPAQMAMRGVMEKNLHRCIFILALNHLEGIKEDALLSRCSIFRFKTPSVKEQVKTIIKIVNDEGIIFEDGRMIDDIVIHYKGDMRAILVDCLEALRGNDGVVTKEDLYKIYEAEDIHTMVDDIVESEHPKWEFFRIYKSENFDVRIFLAELYEKLGHQHSRIFAEVDSRLRGNCNPVVQMGYLFDTIKNENKELK